MNRELIGKSYEQAEAFVVTPAQAAAYAEATDASIDAYIGDDAIAPPMFGVAYSFGALTAPILDGDLGADLLRLVHGEQDMRFLRAVRPGDEVRSVSRIEDIALKSSGELLVLAIESRDQSGELVLESTSSLFIRSPRRGGPDRAKAANTGSRDEELARFGALPQVLLEQQRVSDDQSLRYAEASGDHNPIHTDDDAAKIAGLPGVILQGLCTMAFAHNALVRHTGGDPMKVARLAVRFSRPVLMGAELSIDVRGPTGGPLSLRVTDQDDDVVLENGVAELRG